MDKKGTHRLYTIGELSELCNIPTKTLRFYEDKGLLIPEERGEDNNYRYYTYRQLLEVIFIKELKHLGFSLKEIEEYKSGKKLNKLIRILEEKDGEVEKEIVALKKKRKSIKRTMSRLTEVHELLNTLDEKEEIDHQFEVVVIPETWVVYTKYESDINADNLFLDRYAEIMNLRDKLGLFSKGPLMAVFHGDYINQFIGERDILEVLMPVLGRDLKPSDHVRIHGGYQAAKTVHKGHYKGFFQVYEDFLTWGKENAFLLNGPVVEAYIVDPVTADDEDEYITDIYFPVKKVE